MALPTTISGAAFTDQNYYAGPWIDSNGNVYALLLSSSRADIYKATDPTSSFTLQDSAGSPTTIIAASLWGHQASDTIHVGSTGFISGAFGEYRYHRFTTSDHGTTPDEWTIIDELIETPADLSSTAEASISIAARSDGTVVVLYNGDEDKVKGNPYARVDYNIRSTGGTWGGPNQVTSGMSSQEVNYFGSVIVLGASDKCHFFWNDSTNTTGKHASLTSGDSLGSTEDVDSSISVQNHPFGPGIYFDDSGTERIRVPYQNSTSNVALVQIDADDGTPALVEDISDNDVFIANGSPAQCLAVDGTTAHLLYGATAAAAGQDLYHDQAATPQGASDWGTDTEELDAVTINRISSNVYTRSGTKYLAYVYNDGGTVKYNEKSLGAGPSVTYPGWYQSIGGWW